MLRYPEIPSSKSPCSVYVVVEHPDGSYEFLPNSTPRQLSAAAFACRVRELLDITGPYYGFKYDIDAVGEPTTFNLHVNFKLPLRQSPRSNGKRTTALVGSAVLVLKSINTEIDERSLQRLFFNDWHSGSFEVAFPELNSVSREISSLEISNAVRSLESQEASLEKNVSLLGFSIRVSQLAQWGFVVLLAVQLYLWLHLHELSNRIEANAEGWNVAWIGLYRTRAAAAFATISCFVLPVLAAVTLARRLASTPFYYHRTILAASWSAALLSTTIGLLTVWRLMKLRQNLPLDAGAEQRSSEVV